MPASTEVHTPKYLALAVKVGAVTQRINELVQHREKLRKMMREEEELWWRTMRES